MTHVSTASTAISSLQASLTSSMARAADGDYKTAGAGHRVKDSDGDYKATPSVSAGAASRTSSSTLAAITALKQGGG